MSIPAGNGDPQNPSTVYWFLVGLGLLVVGAAVLVVAMDGSGQHRAIALKLGAIGLAGVVALKIAHMAIVRFIDG